MLAKHVSGADHVALLAGLGRASADAGGHGKGLACAALHCLIRTPDLHSEGFKGPGMGMPCPERNTGIHGTSRLRFASIYPGWGWCISCIKRVLYDPCASVGRWMTRDCTADSRMGAA